MDPSKSGPMRELLRGPFQEQKFHHNSNSMEIWFCSHLSCDEVIIMNLNPDSNVNVANMGPIWGRQDLGGPHVGSMNFAIWLVHDSCAVILMQK